MVFANLLFVANKPQTTSTATSKLINSLHKWFVLYYLVYIHPACHNKIIKHDSKCVFPAVDNQWLLYIYPNLMVTCEWCYNRGSQIFKKILSTRRATRSRVPTENQPYKFSCPGEMTPRSFFSPVWRITQFCVSYLIYQFASSFVKILRRLREANPVITIKTLHQIYPIFIFLPCLSLRFWWR